MGSRIFKQVTEMTGLPPELVQRELKKYLDLNGIAIEDLTIETLRQIMIQYLSETVEDTLESN